MNSYGVSSGYGYFVTSIIRSLSSVRRSLKYTGPIKITSMATKLFSPPLMDLGSVKLHGERFIRGADDSFN